MTRRGHPVAPISRLAMEALEETKRFLHEGHAAILKVKPGRDDDSAEAFQQFRRGVTRADGSHELSLLKELEHKQKVFSFLVDFAQHRRSHRRQVSSVIGILLKDSTWQEAAKESGILQLLPEEEKVLEPTEPEKAEPVKEEGYGKAESTRSHETDPTAADTAVLAFHELQEMNFECQPEAAEALSRFAQGVVLVAQWQQEELKRIDALEPKLPMLRLLCQAHHFFPYQQDQILHLLEDLLHSCDSWRIAAQGDFEVSSYLGNIRLIADSPDTSPEHHYRSSDEEAEGLHHHGGLKARWMWQDAGRYGGIIGVGLAKLNPGRWSQVLCVEDIIADLENYLDGPSSTRPVRLEVRRATGRRRMEASSVAEAVQKLIEEVSVDDAK